MAEYIKLEEALRGLCENCVWAEKCTRYKKEPTTRCAQYTAIVDIPAADVQEVMRGRWAWSEHEREYMCTNCGTRYDVKQVHIKVGRPANYCPNCGAKMDERSEDDNG